MAKFYVQSGNLKMVLQARDSRCAAIWAAHRTLGDNLPFLDEQPEVALHASENLPRLGEKIRVSQRGFDRPDAKVFVTLDVVSEWSRLLVALERLTASAMGTI